MKISYKSIIKLSILSTVFLVPLVWSPFTFEAFEFTKQYVMFFTVFAGIIAWFSYMIFDKKEIRIFVSPLDIAVVGFVVVAFISTLFSVDSYSSMFGSYSRFTDSFINLLSLTGLYFLIRSHVPELVSRLSVVKAFLVSVGVAVLITFLSIFGLWRNISFIPEIMKQTYFTPVSASLEGFAIVLSLVVVFLVLSLFYTAYIATKRFKIFQWALLLISFLLLVVIDFTHAWVVLLLGLILVIGFSLMQRTREKPLISVRSLWLPALLTLLTFIFLFSPTAIFDVNETFPKEPLLPQGASFGIATESLTNNVKTAFLGSGPGTFDIDFSKYKPVSLNTTNLWQIRFDRAGNYVAELVATIGGLGILLYLTIFGLFLSISAALFEATKHKAKEVFPSMGMVVSMLLVLFISQLVYYQTTVLALMFWMFLALGATSWQHQRVIRLALKKRKLPVIGIVVKTVYIVGIIAIGFTSFTMARAYVADIQYAKVQSQRVRIDQAIESVLSAVRLNSDQAKYTIDLSQLYLSRLFTEAAKPETVRSQQQISLDAQRAIVYLRGGHIDGGVVRGAAMISPNKIRVWEALGEAYSNLAFVEGASEQGVEAYIQAVELEPANPVLRTELGKLFLVLELHEEAKDQFLKAREVKPNYFEATRQYALVLEQEGSVDTAIRELEDLALRDILDDETLFQLGRLYYNEGRTADAIVRFEQALELTPNNSNVIYSLGIAFEDEGRVAEAIQAFQRVLELNPTNEEVEQRLQELRK